MGTEFFYKGVLINDLLFSDKKDKGKIYLDLLDEYLIPDLAKMVV